MESILDSLKAAYYYTDIYLSEYVIKDTFRSGYGGTSSGSSGWAEGNYYTKEDSNSSKALIKLSTRRTTGSHRGGGKYGSFPVNVVNLEVLTHNIYTQNNENFFSKLDKLISLPSKKRISRASFYFGNSIGTSIFNFDNTVEKPYTVCVEFENKKKYGFKYWKNIYSAWTKVNDDYELIKEYWLNHGYSDAGDYYLYSEEFNNTRYKKYFIGILEYNKELGREEPYYFTQPLEVLEAEAYLYRHKLHPNKFSDVKNLIPDYRECIDGNYIFNPHIRQFVLLDPQSKTF